MNATLENCLKLSDNSKGAALMTGASLAFVLNDFMMKLVFTELSVVQSVFLRGLFVCPMLILICLQREQRFANRRPAHAEPRRDFRLRRLEAGREPTGQDLVLQPGIGFLHKVGAPARSGIGVWHTKPA